MENQAIAKSYRSQETTLTRRLETGRRISEVTSARPGRGKIFAPREVLFADPPF